MYNYTYISTFQGMIIRQGFRSYYVLYLLCIYYVLYYVLDNTALTCKSWTRTCTWEHDYTYSRTRARERQTRARGMSNPRLDGMMMRGRVVSPNLVCFTMILSRLAALLCLSMYPQAVPNRPWYSARIDTPFTQWCTWRQAPTLHRIICVLGAAAFSYYV